MELERSDRWASIEKLLELKKRIEALESRLGGDVYGDWSPAVDLVDEGDSFRIVIDVPGIKPDDLELEEEGRTITVAGHRDALEGRYVRAERPAGFFRRMLTLPEPIIEGQAQASLKQGVLEIVVPKARGRSVPVE
ncbi:Hsp20/alpha crystallin family protein [Oceanithermus sp.]